MSSRRLPGKVLRIVFGKPMLLYVLERINCCQGLSKIIVATSDTESDMPIVDFCQREGISCYQGSLENVASRFRAVLEEFKLDVFVRVNADSPLLDQRLVQKGLDLMHTEKVDLVTNVCPRSYPSGQSVEVLKSEVFKNAFLHMNDNEDFEHVTKYFYRNQDKYKILNFKSDTDFRNLRMSVDTPDDFRIFSSIIAKMTMPHWEYDLEGLIKIYNETVKYT